MSIESPKPEVRLGSHSNASGMPACVLPRGNDRPHDVPGLKAEEDLLPGPVPDREPVLVGAVHLPIAPPQAGDTKGSKRWDADLLARILHAGRVNPVGLVIALPAAVEAGLCPAAASAG